MKTPDTQEISPGINRPSSPKEWLTNSQLAALRVIDQITQAVLVDGRVNPIIDLFIESATEGGRLLTEQDISRMQIPEVKPEIGENVVARVVRASLPPEEYSQLAEIRRTAFSQRNIDHLGQQFHAAGGKAVGEKIRKGEIPNPGRITAQRNGFTLWSPDEINLLSKLATSKIFAHKEGTFRGSPDWKKITDFINKEFHKSRPVRTTPATRKYYYEHRPPEE